jgi:hypothetical protein
MLLHCYKSLLEFFGKNQLGNKIQKDRVKEKNKERIGRSTPKVACMHLHWLWTIAIAFLLFALIFNVQ